MKLLVALIPQLLEHFEHFFKGASFVLAEVGLKLGLVILLRLLKAKLALVLHDVLPRGRDVRYTSSVHYLHVVLDHVQVHSAVQVHSVQLLWSALFQDRLPKLQECRLELLPQAGEGQRVELLQLVLVSCRPDERDAVAILKKLQQRFSNFSVLFVSFRIGALRIKFKLLLRSSSSPGTLWELSLCRACPASPAHNPSKAR